MRILVTGATGFIGRHLIAELLTAGHEVVAAVRDVKGIRHRFPAVVAVRVDFNSDTDSTAWLPRLEGIDAVVNCSGILRRTIGQSIEAIHYRGPKALFDACVAADVRRVIQISAISADTEAGTDFAITKKKADDYLSTLDLDWVVLRPSLVYAEGSYGGTSLFRGLAAFPFIVPLVGAGDQKFQPIYMDDLAKTVRQLVEDNQLKRVAISPVGPETLTLRDILLRLRAWLDLPAAPVLSVPIWLVRLMARLGDRFGRGPVNSTALRQLEYGNTVPAEPFFRAIGWMPRTMDVALAARPSHVQDRWHARLYFLRPLLRVSLGLFWIISGITGLTSLDHIASSLEALESPLGDALPPIIILASILNIGLGTLLLFRWRPLFVGILQLVTIIAYSGTLTLIDPDVWVHPFGIVLKNMPIAIAVMALMAIEDDR